MLKAIVVQHRRNIQNHLIAYAFALVVTIAIIALKYDCRNATINIPHASRLLQKDEVLMHVSVAPDSAQLVRSREGKNIIYPSSTTTLAEKQRELKYLAFGASVTWGFGAGGPSKSYIKMLSPHGINAAVSASGPTYPSLCLQSLISKESGNDQDTFDVIVVEFNNPVYDLEHLLYRLRLRYPDALIVVVHLAYLKMIQDKNTGESLDAWADRTYSHSDPHSPFFKHVFSNSDNEWQWNIFAQPTQATIEAVQAIDGYLLTMPLTTNPKDFIDHMDWIRQDWLHFAPRGHEMIARSVLDLVQSVGIVSDPEQGTWGSGDSCFSWYKSGKYPTIPSGHPGYSTNIEMDMFDETQKRFALSIPQEGGTITVHNPFDEPMELFLSYMVSRPYPGKYPRTLVTIENDASSAVLLDPIAPEEYGESAHVSVTKPVGLVQHGDNVVTLLPLERNKPNPFRLISTAVGDRYHDFVGVSTPFYRGDWVISRFDDN